MKLIDQLDLYFEALDKVSKTDAKKSFKDLDDRDIDNDGDVDDTDSYLHNKLKNVALRAEGGEEQMDEFVALGAAEINKAVDQFRKELQKRSRKIKKGDKLPANYNFRTGKFEEEVELDEMSSTASAGGEYMTPHAFSKSGKEDEHDTAEMLGMKKAKASNRHTESTYIRMINQMEGLNEVSYREYKKDPTSTPQQKVNRGIQEVNKMLAEMEKIVANNLRLKQEMGVDSSHFWKATSKRFAKINERMIRVSNRLRELSK
jgi:hypothetical protein